MANEIKINANFGDGRTLTQFGKAITDRMYYLGQTARDSIAATAISALKSIRAVTKIFKESHVKVEVKKDSGLIVGYERKGMKAKPCLRVRGSNIKYFGNEPVRYAAQGDYKTMNVYRFRDEHKDRNFIIVAQSQSQAKQKAKQIVLNRARSYAGLARKALGLLMAQTATVHVNDTVSPKATKIALEQTRKIESVKASGNNGGTYELTLMDNLDYAVDAVKGGQSAIDSAVKKSLNKITGQINHKLKDLLGAQKLDTPFPELVRRKKQS